MSYMKKFNDINESTSIYFVEIGSNDISQYVSKHIDFTTIENREISDYIESLNVYQKTMYLNTFYIKTMFIGTNRRNVIKIIKKGKKNDPYDQDRVASSFYKIDDEWFIVTLLSFSSMNPTNYYYKCDQMDGLKMCLKNCFEKINSSIGFGGGPVIVDGQNLIVK